MISILIAVALLLAVFSWAVAILSAVRVIGMVPGGQRLRMYGQLGWWRFDAIRAVAGDKVAPHLRTYQRSFLAFFVCVLCVAALGALLAIQQQN